MDLFYFRSYGKGSALTQACWNQGSNWKTCCVTAISRSSERHELFYIPKGYQVVHVERWRKNGGWWGGTDPIGRSADPDTAFGAVSRASNTLEAFWVRNGKAVMHAYTENDGNSWANDLVLDAQADAIPGSIIAMLKDVNYILIGQLTAQYAVSTTSKIAALSRTSNNMNLFWVGTDGLLHQAYWKVANGNDVWTSSVISQLPASTGGISAVSMNNDHQEVFWTSPSGTLYHAYWAQAQGCWISEAVPGSTGTLRCQPGSHITAVARKEKNSIEGWCRSIEGKLVHFYYYAN